MNQRFMAIDKLWRGHGFFALGLEFGYLYQCVGALKVKAVVLGK